MRELGANSNLIPCDGGGGRCLRERGGRGEVNVYFARVRVFYRRSTLVQSLSLGLALDTISQYDCKEK